MKLYLKLLLLILIIGLVAPFVLPRPDGQPWLKPGQLLPSLAALTQRVEQLWNGIAEPIKTRAPTTLPEGTRQVYKWRTADGSWKYSDQPPAVKAASEVQTVVVDPDTNLIKAIELPPKSQNPSPDTVAVPQDRIPLPLSVRPSEVNTLLEDAKAAQRQSERRLEMLEKN